MIEVHKLSKQYVSGIVNKRLTRAVDGVNLSVPTGRVFGLTGESGCGKTTLAMLILRLIEPTAGSITIDGKDITRLGKRALRRLRPDYQIIWQNPDTSLSPRLTLKDSIMEPLRYYARGKQRQDEAAILSRCCKMAELPESLLGRYPHEVSGGENQRAVIARLLTLRPTLLIADEPTSSLDVLVQAQILELLKRIQKQLAFTMLFISHDLQAIGFMCDQVAVMRNGKIIESGACDQVLSAPQTPYCRELADNAFRPWRFAS
jgi:peptide/nickel transport system ATP-binding protein